MNTQEIVIRSIKMVDIAYLTIIYLSLSIFISIIIDTIIGDFDKRKADKKSTTRLILEIFLNVSIIGICAYIIRNVIELIPFPLDGVYGFEHKKVKELGGGTIFAFAIFLYQHNLRAKIDYVINKRIIGK